MSIPDIIETSAKRTFHSGVKLFEGDLADLHSAYGATHPKGADEKVLLKIARDPRDNDLLVNEVAVLNHLYPKGQKDEKFFRYLPRIIDTARLPDRRQVTVLPHFEGYCSLAEIIAQYPEGIDFRDMVWMYKRLLSGLGFVHEMGVIHGALLPPHVLVHPTDHGAKIIDWSYALNFAALLAPQVPDPPKAGAAPAKSPGVWDLLRQNLYTDDPQDPAIPKGPPPDPNRMYIKAMSVDYEKFYAPEILRKETPSPASDIFMAAKCIVALLGGDLDTNQLPASVVKTGDFDEPERARTQIQAFLQVSLLANPRKRPSDPWQVHEDFDQLILALVGKRSYRPFSIAARVLP